MSRFSMVVVIIAFTSASCQTPIFMADNCSTWTSAVEEQSRIAGYREGIQGAWPYSGAIVSATAEVASKNLDAALSEDDIEKLGVVGLVFPFFLNLIWPVEKAEKKLESNWRSQHEACYHSAENGEIRRH